jgi:hypothetical protein
MMNAAFPLELWAAVVRERNFLVTMVTMLNRYYTFSMFLQALSITFVYSKDRNSRIRGSKPAKRNKEAYASIICLTIRRNKGLGNCGNRGAQQAEFQRKRPPSNSLYTPAQNFDRRVVFSHASNFQTVISIALYF